MCTHGNIEELFARSHNTGCRAGQQPAVITYKWRIVCVYNKNKVLNKTMEKKE